MKRRTHTRAIHNRNRKIERKPISWGYVLITLFCVAIIAVGFFFAGLQHFATIDLSFKNSKLRKQVDDLGSEKRRLLLAKEVALSPAEITKTARSLGFREVDRELEAMNQMVAANAPNAEPATSSDNKVEQISDIKHSSPAAKQAKEKQSETVEPAKLTKTVLTAAVRDRNVVPAAKVAAPKKQENAAQTGESRARRVNVPIAKNEKPNNGKPTRLR